MAHATLNAHYSISSVSIRFLICFCCSLFLYYISWQEKLQDIRIYLFAAGFMCASFVYFYHLLIAKKRVVMSIDSAGFKDTRLSAAVIPWNAVKSMRPYLSSKHKEEIGVTVEVDPIFWQTLSLRLSSKFSRFANMDSGASASLSTDCLDVDWSEVLQAAGGYTLIKTHDWSNDVI